MVAVIVDVLPGPETGTVPFRRQVVRGLSQCVFQTRELTGLICVVAVATFNPRMAVFLVLSVVVATITARLLKGDRNLLDIGALGFNSDLMGLALGTFYAPEAALWVWVVVLAAVTGAVSVAMARWLPIPFLAAPFILTFWAMWFVADARPELVKFDAVRWPAENVRWGAAVADALGSVLFAPSVVSGVLILVAILVGDWRHGVIAVVAAVVAVAIAAHIGTVGGAINTGYVGFNAVLAALGIAAVVREDLPRAVLAALLATWFFSYVDDNAPVPALASGFVVAVWSVMLLDWLQRRFGPRAPALTHPRTRSV